MAEIPQCPQFKERGCERSELRLVKESDTHFIFRCACCELDWAVSKYKSVAAARHENAARKIQRITEAERANPRRRYSLPKRLA